MNLLLIDAGMLLGLAFFIMQLKWLVTTGDMLKFDNNLEMTLNIVVLAIIATFFVGYLFLLYHTTIDMWTIYGPKVQELVYGV